jgi:hypothetical protein
MPATQQTIDLDTYCDSVAVVHEADGICEEQIHEAIGGISNLYYGRERMPLGAPIHTKLGFASRQVPVSSIVASIEACTGVPTELSDCYRHLRSNSRMNSFDGRSAGVNPCSGSSRLECSASTTHVG